MLKPFRFWCNKILPLVYDDSLSYMELLCKLVEHIQKLDGVVNENAEQLKVLYKYIEDYFNSPEFSEIIDAKLDELVTSGTLDELLQNISNNVRFIPTDAEREQYVQALCETIASYLVGMAEGTCTSLVGTPTNTPFKYACVYCDEYTVIYPNVMTYDAIIDNLYTFGPWDENFQRSGNHSVITIGGVEYPIVFMNCSGFVTLLTKNRRFADSPWAKLFTTVNPTGAELAACCLEYGDTDETPWTFDFMNELVTWRMAENMRASGCTPKLICSKENGVTSFNANLLYLKDGDILFSGNANNNEYSKRYLNAHHCMVYFKTLDALNKAGAVYGVTFKPYSNDQNFGHGFIVHCGGSTDEILHGHMNVLRVDTLDHYMSNAENYENVYGCQVSSNALNSSKLYLGVSGRLVMRNCEIIAGQRHNNTSDDRSLPVNTVTAFSSGTQNGVMSYGQYRYRQSAQPYKTVNGEKVFDFNDYITPKMSGRYTLNTNDLNLLNGPTDAESVDGEYFLSNPTSQSFTFDVIDCTGEGTLSLQTIVLLSTTPHRWERVVNYAGNSSKWKCVY